MRKWLNSDMAYRFIAAMLALLLWAFVSEKLNPQVDNLFLVPVETRGLESGLVVAKRPGTVQVRVQGRRELMEKVSSRDMEVFVNLAHASLGSNELPLEINLPEGIQLVTVSPSPVEVVLDQVSQAQLPVEIKVEGQPREGFRALPPRVSPSQVLVSGPKGILAEVSRGVVNVFLPPIATSYQSRLPVAVRNEQGEDVLDWLIINPPSVEIIVPVVRAGPVKRVPVVVEPQGQPEAGYLLEQIRVEPQQVQVFGSEKALQELSQIVLPLPLGGARADLVKVLELNLPPTLEAEPAQVVVTATLRLQDGAKGQNNEAEKGASGEASATGTSSGPEE